MKIFTEINWKENHMIFEKRDILRAGQKCQKNNNKMRNYEVQF